MKAKNFPVLQLLTTRNNKNTGEYFYSPVNYDKGVIIMNKTLRKAVIAGNWKMNKTATEAAELIDALIPAVKDAGCEVVICVP